MSVPTKPRNHALDGNAVRGPKLSLDTALLCSKLETFRREQEAAQARREKRDAVRNGSYTPLSAARSFAVTSTPLKEIPEVTRSRKHGFAAPAPAIEPPRPLTTDGRIRIPSVQLYAALNSGYRDAVPEAGHELSAKPQRREKMKPETQQHRTSQRRDRIAPEKKEQTSSEPKKCKATKNDDALPALPKPRQKSIHDDKLEDTRREKHDSMEPSSNDGQQSTALQQPSSPQRRRSSALLLHGSSVKPRQSSNASSSSERTRSEYRPGDAAKRRMVMGAAPLAPNMPPRPATSDLVLENARISKFAEHDMFLRGAIPELEEFQFPPKTRPKLAPNDRPDWTQQSQTANEVHHTLRFFHKVDKAVAPDVQPTASQPGKTSAPQDGHLIADAVKIIKQGERLKRRASIMGFFKRL